MTAWCSSTTSVRNVRARSSEGLRTLILGAALVSAETVVLEIVVMSALQFAGKCCSGGSILASPNYVTRCTMRTCALRSFSTGSRQQPARPSPLYRRKRSELFCRDATGMMMTETVTISRPSVAKSVSRPRKAATLSASALAQHLDCSRTYLGKLEGGGLPLDQSRVAVRRAWCGCSGNRS